MADAGLGSFANVWVDDPDLFLIEHRRPVGNHVLWWGPRSSGYTTELSEAGVYTRAQAEAQERERDSDRAVPIATARRIATLGVRSERLERAMSQDRPVPTFRAGQIVRVGYPERGRRVVLRDGCAGVVERVAEGCRRCTDRSDPELSSFDGKAGCVTGPGCGACGFHGYRVSKRWRSLTHVEMMRNREVAHG